MYRARVACVALCGVLSVGCGRGACGEWEAVRVDARLRAFTTLIAVGEGGALAKSEYPGYAARDSGTTNDLLAVYANKYQISDRCPFVAVGRAGTIRISQDEGDTWLTPDVDAVDADLRGVTYCAYPDNFGVAVGDGGVILVGFNVGSRWKSVPSPTTQRLHAVAMDSEGRATAVGAQGTVIRTLDEGETWETVSVPAMEDLLSIEFAVVPETQTSEYTVQGYITGRAGTLLYSPDGATWERIDSGATEDLRQVIMHHTDDTAFSRPYLLGDTRVFSWSPGETGLTVEHELRRPLLGLAQYFGSLHVLAEDGVLLSYIEPYECEPSQEW